MADLIILLVFGAVIVAIRIGWVFVQIALHPSFTRNKGD
jgi:hypothetical protein